MPSLRLLASFLACAAFAPAATPPKKILFFSKSTLYEHAVIRDPSLPFTAKPGNAMPGLAQQVLKDLGAKHNFTFTFSKDGSLFGAKYLAQFDAFFFYTTGDLTESGTDGNPTMTATGKHALLAAIRHGKGFIGVHSASDTFHSPGNKEHGPARYVNDGAKADAYIKMLGGEFIMHGQQQVSHLIVADPRFPGLGPVATGPSLTEEWYSLKNFAPDLHVLLVQDTAGMTGVPYARPNYPSTWIHLHGQGRVFYTSMGHRDDVWQSPMYQALLLAALNWTTGRTEADTTPNLASVAPQADELPHLP